MKTTKELWVLNTTDIDVSISDLGVRVRAGQTLNIYKHAPTLTEEQVQKSLNDGVLAAKLKNQLKLVKKAPSGKDAVKAIKQSNESVKAVRTHSSIVVETKQDVLAEAVGLDFADYGVDESIVSSVVDHGGVIIQAKEDKPEPLPVPPASPKTEQSGSTILVAGEVHDLTPKDVVKQEPFKVTRHEDSVKVDLAPVQQTEKKAVVDAAGIVTIEELPKEPEPPQEPSGMRVASKTKGGITVMQVKE
jgi:hypothetical protein